MASCAPEGGPETGGDDAQEFAITVSNIGATTAHIKVQAKEADRTFYSNVFPEADINTIGTPAQFMTAYYEIMKSAVAEGQTTWARILDTGVAEWDSGQIVPSTDYIVIAFGIDAQGNLTSSEPSYKKFSSLESTFDPAQWYGYWDVTSSKYANIVYDPILDDAVTTLTEESLTKRILITDATELLEEPGYVLVYGLDDLFLDVEDPTNLANSVPAIGQVIDNSIEIVNQFVVYETEQGYTYEWCGAMWYNKSGISFMPVSGDYAPYTYTMAADGSVEVKSYEGILSDESTFKIDMFRVFMMAGQQFGEFYPEDQAQYLYGDGFSFAKVENELAPAKLSKKSNFRVTHKMATKLHAARTFSSAVNFAK